MNKIIIGDYVKDLSKNIVNESRIKNMHYSPIDRFFIEENGYLEKILSVNYLEFLLYNFEQINPTYTIQLFLCVPEIWEKVNFKDINTLIENFTNSFSFYSLIGFTYKYLEIDLLDEIFYNKNVNISFKKNCSKYFPNILATLYMDEYDYFEFKENLFGISLEQIKNLQKKFHENIDFKNAISYNKLHKKLISIKSNL
nr:hypothetical protein [uncultured Chryseobacterium sp.]